MGWWEKIRGRLLAEPVDPSVGDEGDMRLPARIRASCKLQGGALAKIEIRSLSLNGLMFRCAHDVAKGCDLILRVPLGQDVSTRITEIVELKVRSVWSRKLSGDEYDVGVCYIESANRQRDEWLNRILETYGINLWDDRRETLRHRVELPATINREGQEPLPGLVRNLSAGGLQAALENSALQVGERVIVEFCPTDGMWLKMRGCVVNESRTGPSQLVGVRFESVKAPQSDALLDMVIRMLRPAEPQMEE